MSAVYSTEELIAILAAERKACMNGQRFKLLSAPAGVSPAIAPFLQTEGLQKFTAYNDFRATVHAYQRQHHVSGIVWQTLTVHGQTLQFPKVDEQLIALPADLTVLRQAKAAIYTFWQQVTAGMELYLSLHAGKLHQPIAPAAVDHIAQRTEWMSLCRLGRRDRDCELILQLGWGQPADASYRRGFPESGSESIQAVPPGRQPTA